MSRCLFPFFILLRKLCVKVNSLLHFLYLKFSLSSFDFYIAGAFVAFVSFLICMHFIGVTLLV